METNSFPSNNFKGKGKSSAQKFGGPQKQQTNKPNLDLYKTKLCPVVKIGAECSRGIRCHFAHSHDELRSKPNLSKTKICENFAKGNCDMGDNCNYAHSELELRSTPDIYKTVFYDKENFITQWF